MIIIIIWHVLQSADANLDASKSLLLHITITSVPYERWWIRPESHKISTAKINFELLFRK